MTTPPIEPAYWCERVRTCFHMFATAPHTLQHLLLFGPPGSGKTTSAGWLVDSIWGTQKSLMCMSMNAADERSLESIRQKVFPFLNVDWREDTSYAPRFLILDECETLTEAAQLSLQTMLNMDPHHLCVILICNSQSRIHPKLRQRMLKIRYDSPVKGGDTASNDLFTALTRGDLRQDARRDEMEHRIWNILHCHPADIPQLLWDPNTDEEMICTELLLLADYFQWMDVSFLQRLHDLYPYMSNSALPKEKKEEMWCELVRDLKRKIESSISI